MGYVFDFQDARAYRDWIAMQSTQWTAAMSNELMINLLKPVRGESILDIGCGTGAGIQHLLQMGLNTTGLDPSPYMLQMCADHFGQRVNLYRGFAEELPFDDNSFNHAVFLISLEFVNDPVKAIEEACRVAKDRVFFGFLNRFALKGVQRWRKTFWNAAQVFQNARLFTVWELKKMVRSVAGPVPVQWRTVCQLPQSSAKVFRNIENFDILQRCPFGAFAGMVVTLVPRFRTRPLAIRYKPEKSRSVIPKSVPAGPSGMDSHGGYPCKPTFSNPLGSRKCSATCATTAAPSRPAVEDCAA